MPPKQSKADREKKKKEEAERKALEEAEQQRLEEERRLEEEKRRQELEEKRARERAEEETRFIEETNRLNLILDGHQQTLELWKKERLEQNQWDHYLSCNDLPDPSNEKALNAYFTLCKEKLREGSENDIDGSLKNISAWLMLSKESTRLMYGDGLPSPSETERGRYREVISTIHSLVHSSLKQVTLHYMQEAEKHTDSETFNLRVEASLDHQIVFCLWGNVMKDPRLKSFSFKDHFQLTLELPKPLLLADAAIQVLQLPFDNLSPQSRTYQCKRSPPSTGVSTISGGGVSTNGDAPDDQGDDETGVAGGGGGGEDGGGGDGESVRKESVGSKATSEQPPEDDAVKEGEVTSMVGLETEVAEKGKMAPTAGEQQEGEAPPQATPTTGNGPAEGDVNSDEVDLRQFRPARGPILLGLFEMPPQPKSVNNWTIRKVISQNLLHHPYPPEAARPPPPPPGAGEEDDEKANVRPAILPGSSAWPAISITMQLPMNYLFSEDPQLARWDDKSKIWRTGDLKEVVFNIEEKTVSFKTFYFSPLAIMVDQYVNMPYQSWELLPTGANSTLFKISGGVVEITVDIKEQTSVLVGPTDVPDLTHLLNIPMTARELMEALSKSGAIFFPQLDADKYVSITPKRPLVELSVYQSMALASCAFAFQWSQWNSEASRSKVVLRVAQCSSSSSDCKETSTEKLSWSTYLGGRKSYKMKVNESSEEFTTEAQDGCESHPGLFSALEHDATQPTKERLKTTSPMHIEAVKLWLDSTKVLTYS